MLSSHIQLGPVLKPIVILNTSGESRDSRVKYKFIFRSLSSLVAHGKLGHVV